MFVTCSSLITVTLIASFHSPERQHPPFFEELDQLYEHLQTAGKKPVHMSQRTLDTLQTLKDEYEQNDIHEKDAIGHFVNRQAAKLGLVHATSEWCTFSAGLQYLDICLIWTY